MSVEKADRDIQKLKPYLIPVVETFLAKAKFNGWDAFITEGFRSFERQSYLYAQGRTRSGNIITNAKAGQSNHNFGMAFDIAFKNKNGDVSWDVDLFNLAGKVGKQLGLKWGGDWWRFIDRPHFYMTKPPYNKAFIDKWKGRLILDVEDAGKLYYVNPRDGKRYHLDFSDLQKAQESVRTLATGFKHKNILKIPKG